MVKIYTDANPSTIAYYIEDSNSGWLNLPPGNTSMQAEYIAIIFGLNSYFRLFQPELDSRQYDLDIEKLIATGEYDYARVSSPAEQAPRALPPPILVLCDNQVVVNQLSRQYHIGDDKLRKLAQTIWQMTRNLDVKFEWVSRKDNPAGKMLK